MYEHFEIKMLALMGELQSNLIPKPPENHELIHREIPTVFVKMDLTIGYSISTTIQNVIPFVAITTGDHIYRKY